MRARVLAFVLVAGCRASGAAPADDPTPAPTECTASYGTTLPEGWVDTGAALHVTLKAGKPTGAEAHSADGKVRPVPLPAEGREKQWDAIVQEICRLGGLYGAVDPVVAKKNEGTLIVRVLKPSAPSEKADLALFCADPPDPRLAPGKFDPAMMPTMATLILAELLTTPRWRSWIVAQKRRLLTAEEPARDKIYAEMVAELRAAGAPEDCWFAGAVRPRRPH
jgi:hypothetical protein